MAKKKDDEEIKVYAPPDIKALFKRWAEADGRSLSNWMIEAGKLKASVDAKAADKALGKGK